MTTFLNPQAVVCEAKVTWQWTHFLLLPLASRPIGDWKRVVPVELVRGDVSSDDADGCGFIQCTSTTQGERDGKTGKDL